ncbi:MAG: (2Fe-2S)-binding protein [Elusimicrobia bacterium]|nr:(2Fe-2S)-binding protein [Elusimicrobiota bacterium]MBU2614452.1 (2Fe-2S)-binding protein [Elusimicrobiota bacterium]
MRIVEHPILGKLEKKKKIKLWVNGRQLEAYENEPIAAALANTGLKVFHRTQELNEPRGIFCAIGRCTDCVMIVDGQPNVRTCVTPAKNGMRIQTQKGLGKWSVKK